MRSKIRSLFVLAGDILVLYLALFFTLLARYRGQWEGFWDEHVFPFSIIFSIWIFVFYISGIYEPKRLRNDLDFFKTLWATLFVNAVIALVFFYSIPYFGIAPKTNLFIFIVIVTIFLTLWRRSFNRLTISLQTPSRVLLIGDSPAVKEVHDFIRSNPQVGYEAALALPLKSLPENLKSPADWRGFLNEHLIDIVVVPRRFKHESNLSRIFYELLSSGATILDVPAFYELVLKKIPLEEIAEEWFLENLFEHRRFYDDLKAAGEIFLAIILFVALLPLKALIAIITILSSPGPVIYRQTRMGKNGKLFTLYKFRTMREGAETNGAQWAERNDSRVTGFGRFLRASHLDELPQLLNIMKGELSFVGPRPERPEFMAPLKEKIPHYDIRHIVKPGITGWAQINFRYGASVEDAAEKLKYDIYYIKNRSLALDLATLFRTFKSFFVKKK